MTTGTKVIQNALAEIGVHSPVSPASPHAIQRGKEKLNGMIAMWQDKGIDMGCVPLRVPGSELSEPLGAKNAIEANLALEMAPLFKGSTVSMELKAAARTGYNEIKRQYKTIEIPQPVVRETLPKGQGNKNYRETPFFKEGSEIG